MIKRWAVAVMATLATSAAFASAPSCDWQFVAKSDESHLQLHFKGCSVKTNGSTASVWVRYLYGSVYHYKHERVLLQKQYWTFDCANQRYAVTQQVFYNMQNKPYAYVPHNPPRFTEEDLIVESIGKKVCPKLGQ